MEKTVCDFIDEISNDDTRILVLRRQIDRIASRQHQNRKELLKRLEAGESSADRIFDFVFATITSFREEIVSFYQGLQNLVQAHYGERVLLIGREEREILHGGPHRESMTQTDMTFLLGIINGDSLIFDYSDFENHPFKNRVFIPTTHYLRDQHWHTKSVPGNLSQEFNFNLSILNFIRPPSAACEINFLPEDQSKVVLKIGEAEIEEWLGQQVLAGQRFIITIEEMTKQLLTLV